MKCKICGEDPAIILVEDKEKVYCFNCNCEVEDEPKDEKDVG